MKYLVGRKGFELQVREKPIPVPGPGQVLVKVYGCGVCGTDLHFLRECEDWTALGHEVSGVVEALGPQVSAVKVGDPVVVEDVGACGCCEACQNGRPDLCTAMTSLDGQSGMGEYLLVPEKMLVHCNGLRWQDACFVEPLTVCLHAFQTANLQPMGTIAVWGLGPLGLMTIAVARYFGAGKVIAVASRRGSARNEYREKLALEMGADAVLYSEDEDFVQQMASGFDRVDAAVVTAPPKTLPLAIETISYGGRVVPIGINLGSESRITVDVDHLVFNKKAIVPMLSEPALQYPRSVALLRKGAIPVDKLLSHCVPMTELQNIRDIFQKDPSVMKVILTP